MKMIKDCFFLFLLFSLCFSIPSYGQYRGKSFLDYYFQYQKIIIQDSSRLLEVLAPLEETVRSSNDSPLQISYYLLRGEGLMNQNPVNFQKVHQAFKQAEKVARKANNHKDLIWILNKIGFNYYLQRKMSESLPYFLESRSLMRFVADDEILDPLGFYKRMGYFLGTIGNTEEGVYFLKKSLDAAQGNPVEQAEILDNLGLKFLVLRDTLGARKAFLTAIDLARENNISVRYAKALGNMAIILAAEGKEDEAVTNLKEDIHISKSHNSRQNTLYASLQLADLFVQLGRLDEALVVIKEIKALINNQENLVTFEQRLAKIQLAIAVKMNNSGDELEYRRILDSLSVIADKWDGENVVMASKWMTEKQKMSDSIELAHQSIQDEKNKNIWYAALAVIFVFLSILIYLRLRKVQEVHSSCVNVLEKDKSAVDDKLMEVEEQLKEYNHLVEYKGNEIKQLYAIIERLKHATMYTTIDRELRLKDFLGSHLLTEDRWTLFKQVFCDNYPEFCESLSQQFPEVNDTFRRYIFLYKLGLDKHEISKGLGVSLDAVKKTKQRFRKKVGDVRFHGLEALIDSPHFR